MKSLLLDYLKCPFCNDAPTNLELAGAVYCKDEIFSGTLACKRKHRFPIREYIPDFVSPEDKSVNISNKYDSIWQAHAKEVYGGRTKEYIVKFQEFARLPRDLGQYFKDKIVLDAGCGNGRFSYLAGELGAKHVIAVDFSNEALQRAIISTGNPANCSFIRANLSQLPLLPRFDFAFSMGVLHHTPDTKESYFNIAKLVKPGGYISLYLYRKHTLPLITWPLRLITLRVDKNIIHRLCDNLGFTYDSSIIPKLPVKSFFAKLRRLDLLGIHQLTYEGLTTPYLREHSLKEVKTWFKETGVELISSTNILSASGQFKHKKNL